MCRDIGVPEEVFKTVVLTRAAPHAKVEIDLPLTLAVGDPQTMPARLISLFVLLALCAAPLSAADAVPNLETRRELFVDNWLIDSLDGTRLKMHAPQKQEIALQLDRPWEGAFCAYFTVIKDGDLYRLYYRGVPEIGDVPEVTCYAESRDGKTFTRPNLDQVEVYGTRQNNIIRVNHRATHNFCPFLDKKPGVPAAEKFKALGGNGRKGLLAFTSADGINWKQLQEKSVITKGAFDSQNVSFWSEAEGLYVSYFRIFEGGVRSVARATSDDFIQWSEPVAMTYGDTPREHLYTSQTHPYFRAPHIYMAFPMRFRPGQRVISEADADRLEVVPNYRKDSSEGVFMTTRGENRYDRTFMEAFFRPGLDPGNWVSRVNMAALGVVPTGPGEMSIYYSQHYAQPSHHLIRCTLRTDGFVSVNGPYAGGELVTKPFKFSGQRLVMNYSTSAAGSLRVEMQDATGKPLDGYSLADCPKIVGDHIDGPISWKKTADVAALKGQVVRLRVVLHDADLYSFQFAP